MGMLVLSRREDEKIYVGDDTIIQVVRIASDKVRLGITCPKHVPVHRAEVWEAIREEREWKEIQRRATSQEPPDPASVERLRRLVEGKDSGDRDWINRAEDRHP